MPTKKLSAVLEFAGKAGASLQTATSSAVRGIDAIGKELTETTKEQTKLRKEMKKYVRDGKIVNSKYWESQRRLDALSKSAARLARRQRALRMASSAAAGAMKFGARAVKGLAIGAAAAAAGIGTAIIRTAAFGDELGKASRRLGLSVESLEALRFIAERSGVEQTVLEKSIQKVQIALGEAADNAKGPYAKAFRSLGIDHRKFKRLKPEEQIAQLADAYSKLEDQSQKTFVLQKLLGEEGLLTAQILENGGDGVRALSAEFEALGGSMGKGGTDASEAFQDALTNMKQGLGTAARQMSVVALPKITEAFARFTNYLTDNQDKIRDVGELIGDIIDKMGTAAEKTINFLSAWKQGSYRDPTTGESLTESAERSVREHRERRAARKAEVYYQASTFNITQRPGESTEELARRVDALAAERARREDAASMSSSYDQMSYAP